MDIMKKYINLLNFGIDLKMTTKEEEYYFLQFFIDWINNMGFDLTATSTSSTEASLMKDDKVVLIVKVKDSTLTMDPKSEEAQEGIMLVIKFIAEEYETVRDEFAELVKGTKKIVPKKEEKKKDDGDDEFEWI
jgi:hypothetical protein